MNVLHQIDNEMELIRIDSAQYAEGQCWDAYAYAYPFSPESLHGDAVAQVHVAEHVRLFQAWAQHRLYCEYMDHIYECLLRLWYAEEALRSPCPDCGGSGKRYWATVNCATCGGTGALKTELRRGA